MKNKTKITLCLLIFLFILISYSILVYQSVDVNKMSTTPSDMVIEYNVKQKDISCCIQYPQNSDTINRIYVKCTNKYLLTWGNKLSLNYNPDYVTVNSFERNVYLKNLVEINCIESSFAPASSYRGSISWYTNFNIVGCNITDVMIIFNVINHDVDIDDIISSFYLDY